MYLVTPISILSTFKTKAYGGCWLWLSLFPRPGTSLGYTISAHLHKPCFVFIHVMCVSPIYKNNLALGSWLDPQVRASAPTTVYPLCISYMKKLQSLTLHATLQSLFRQPYIPIFSTSAVLNPSFHSNFTTSPYNHFSPCLYINMPGTWRYDPCP